MNYILFDDSRINNFLPLTHTRPVGSLRCGILTSNERWEKILNQKVSFKTSSHLQEKFPMIGDEVNVLINSGLFPSDSIIQQINNLNENDCLVYNEVILAICLNETKTSEFVGEMIASDWNKIQVEQEPTLLNQVWDIFSKNDIAIRFDYELLTKGRTSQKVSETNTVLGNQLFIEEGAKVECSMLNTTSGPIYIGKDAEIMEGCMVRGPFALGEHGVLKMGAKIYGATTIGDGCKVGGEVNNSVFYANSSKAHDGFIGNAVIGEWCNLGADSNNSNLKNNYEEVKLWNEKKKTFVKTGMQFCGLIMGDHSKCGINTMFNTGTVVGVSCNVYGAGFPRNFIPSFSWGSANGFMEYQLSKAIDTATRVFARRQLEFNEIEKRLISSVFEITNEQRNY